MRHSIRLTSLALLCALAAPAGAAQTRAYVLTSDFASPGGLDVVDLDTRAVTQDVATVHSDARLRWYRDRLYVVNRFGQDNIQVIDPAQGYATLQQFSTGNGSNPYDIALVSPTKAYVTRYASTDLLIVNPASGATLGVVPLGLFSDGDGLPEMDHMMIVGNRLFVSLQRLGNFAPTNPSLVAVVDVDADTVLDVDPALPGKQAIALQGRNPTTVFAYDHDSGRLLLGCTGAYGAPDGGVEWIDPVTLQSEGYAVTEAALLGDVLDLVWSGAARSYAIVSDASFNTALVAWSATDGTRLGTVFSPGGFSLSDAAINDRGEIYVCRGEATTPGLYVISPSDLPYSGPYATGLPPQQITFDEPTHEPVAVAPVAGPLRLSAPWPNPARAEARLSLRLARAGEVAAEAFDAAGRRVRRLEAGRREAGEVALRWDLRDGAGRRIPAGLYLVRVRAGGGEAVRRLAVLDP